MVDDDESLFYIDLFNAIQIIYFIRYNLMTKLPTHPVYFVERNFHYMIINELLAHNGKSLNGREKKD